MSLRDTRAGRFVTENPLLFWMTVGALARIPLKALDPNFSVWYSLGILLAFAAIGVTLEVRKSKRQSAGGVA